MVSYVQVVKTTDAELKGFRLLSKEVKAEITPLFELTRSRTSKKVPDGDINKRVDHVLESVGENPFILDLTSHEDLSNSQIDYLLDDSDGFKNWTDFVMSIDHEGVIPVVHLFMGDGVVSTTKQVERLVERFETLAVRFSLDDEDALEYLKFLSLVVPENIKLIVVVEIGYLEGKSYISTKNDAEDFIDAFMALCQRFFVSFVASSFPSSVTALPDCYDDRGVIPVLEWEMFLDLRDRFPRLIYGDYGSIHPIRYPSRGGSWVPRVDYPLSRNIVYARYRRDDGGYIQAAKDVVSLPEYDRLLCWGTGQIESAALGAPNGKSPSFWISARLNIHSTRKVLDLKAFS